MADDKRKMEEINFGRVYMYFGTARGFRAQKKRYSENEAPGHPLPGSIYVRADRLSSRAAVGHQYVSLPDS